MVDVDFRVVIVLILRVVVVIVFLHFIRATDVQSELDVSNACSSGQVFTS